MTLGLGDWIFFLGFFGVVIGFSLWKSRGTTSGEDYFLAGRGLPWWLIGISIVAANISTELQVLIAFAVLCAMMAALTFARPLKEPKTLPERKDFDLQTDPKVKALGGIVIAAVIVFILIFW